MKWLAVVGEPCAGVGQDGDLCISTSTGYVYQRRAGVWTCYGRAWHD